MLKARFIHHILDFKRPSGTSRGILKQKDAWFIFVWDTNKPELVGIGECSIIHGLSIDAVDGYQDKIKEVCDNISEYKLFLDGGLERWPSIYFGLETAILDFEMGAKRILFDSDFTSKTKAIDINGLVWMGDVEFMHSQIQQKLKDGFSCVKLKIGAINFDNEIALIRAIRDEYSSDRIEIRVDANGAFAPHEALDKLLQLSKLDLHSIEQPIKAGQISKMASLCANTPLPIALDEELIGITDYKDKESLLKEIRPQYIILKPSLLGGFKGCNEWIKIANELSIPWWITSALESNIGLNAIAQWSATLNNDMPQGLGTGMLYTNNIPSPLEVGQGKLYYKKDINWDLSILDI